MEENKDIIEDNILESKEQDEEDNIEELREQLRKKQEKKLKRMEKTKNRDDEKRLKISGIVAAIAGILEIFAGLNTGSSMQICIGITFICCGYFFFNLGKRAQREKEKRGR